MPKTLESEKASKEEEKAFYVYIFFSKTKDTEIAFKFNSEKKTNSFFKAIYKWRM